jgi:hypothetical protein
MDWMEHAAAALEVEPVGRREAADVLKVGRDVARAVERRATPLATFLLGSSVQRRVDAGMPRDEAFRTALSALRHVVPAGPEPGDESTLDG